MACMRHATPRGWGARDRASSALLPASAHAAPSRTVDGCRPRRAAALVPHAQARDNPASETAGGASSSAAQPAGRGPQGLNIEGYRPTSPAGWQLMKERMQVRPPTHVLCWQGLTVGPRRVACAGGGRAGASPAGGGLCAAAGRGRHRHTASSRLRGGPRAGRSVGAALPPHLRVRGTHERSPLTAQGKSQRPAAG